MSTINFPSPPSPKELSSIPKETENLGIGQGGSTAIHPTSNQSSMLTDEYIERLLSSSHMSRKTEHEEIAQKELIRFVVEEMRQESEPFYYDGSIRRLAGKLRYAEIDQRARELGLLPLRVTWARGKQWVQEAVTEVTRGVPQDDAIPHDPAERKRALMDRIRNSLGAAQPPPSWESVVRAMQQPPLPLESAIESVVRAMQQASQPLVDCKGPHKEVARCAEITRNLKRTYSTAFPIWPSPPTLNKMIKPIVARVIAESAALAPSEEPEPVRRSPKRTYSTAFAAETSPSTPTEPMDSSVIEGLLFGNEAAREEPEPIAQSSYLGSLASFVTPPIIDLPEVTASTQCAFEEVPPPQLPETKDLDAEWRALEQYVQERMYDPELVEESSLRAQEENLEEAVIDHPAQEPPLSLEQLGQFAEEAESFIAVETMPPTKKSRGIPFKGEEKAFYEEGLKSVVQEWPTGKPMNVAAVFSEFIPKYSLKIQEKFPSIGVRNKTTVTPLIKEVLGTRLASAPQGQGKRISDEEKARYESRIQDVFAGMSPKYLKTHRNIALVVYKELMDRFGNELRTCSDRKVRSWITAEHQKYLARHQG